MYAVYPTGDANHLDPEAERTIESVIEIVHSIRNTRAEHQVESNKWVTASVYAGDLAARLKPYSAIIQTLSQSKPLELIDSHYTGRSDEKDLVAVLKETEVVIPLASMVDMEAERNRLQKEYTETKANVERLAVRLKDPNFVNKAPPAVVQKERARYDEGADKLQRLQQQIERFSQNNP